MRSKPTNGIVKKASTILVASLCAVGTSGFTGPVNAQQVTVDSEQSPPPRFEPPNRGAPETRIGGGTRGANENTTLVQVLVPESTALSATPAPTLYWFLAHSVANSVEITLQDDVSIDPVLVINLKPPISAGFQHVELAKHHVVLQSGREYEWAVAIVHDPEQRSKDTLSSGTLMYEPPAKHLMQELETLHGIPQARLYARHGYWFDAFETLMRETDKNQSPAASRARDGLLRDVGLPALDISAN